MKTLAAAVLALASALAIQTDDEVLLERGHTLADRFFAGELEAFWDEFGPNMQIAMPLEALRMFHGQVEEQLGAQQALLDESIVRSGAATFVRKARYEKAQRTIETILSFDDEQRISGFLIRPSSEPAPTEYLDYETKADLHLPFEGDWHVYWGGRTLEQNYHVAYADQRFAYDIVAMKDGQTYEGDPKKNESYFCFDRPILAPAKGKVVVAVDGVEDNVPGEMNPRQAAGNHVILDLGGGEYALLAHFRNGTLAVKPGDEVASGALLGHCGNSGNTSEPHLHFHLQTQPAFGKGVGLPAKFNDYLADGEPVARGEPVKGQRIRRR